MKIEINKLKVLSKDLSSIYSYANYSNNADYYQFIDTYQSSIHALKLYAYLSEQVNDSVILDIGTKCGNSAVALSFNEKNKVISYDLVDAWGYLENIKKENITFKIGNFMEDNFINYEDVSIILIDVDPHDGKQEPPMIEFLEKNNWSGLILLDDIKWEFEELRKMWDNFNYEKYDLTDIGHFSGTGLINLGNRYEIKIY